MHNYKIVRIANKMYKNKTIKYQRFLGILFVVFFVFSGCRFKVANDKNKLPGDLDILQKTITAYYEFEQKKEWQQTYLYRPIEFRKIVPKETYSRIMTRDAEGWQLLEFEILDFKRNFSTVAVRIKFTEKSQPNKIIKIAESTEWEIINNNWYCIDCGERTHLSLNAPLIRPVGNGL